jgi:ABC-type uncharacterized transport system permease subunit
MMPLLPAITGTALFVLGLLLFLEMLRPFRDLRKDGPLALAAFALGALTAGTALVLGCGPALLAAVALGLNALALAAALLLLRLARPRRLL